MGSDKALLKFEGIPLAVRTAQTLLAAGCSSVHLVGRQPALATLDLPLIVEEESDHHPLFGLAAALSSCQQQLMLIAPCDIINLAPSHIQSLLDYGKPCIAVSGSRTHPLLGIFSVESAKKAHLIAAGNGAVHTFTSNMPKVELPLPCILNANFPADLLI
jgi:molybdopterin-guanine dinucleotide biosynthesis protein A